MADDSQEVADIINALGASPAPIDVYHATREYDTRYLASAGAAAAAGGGGGGSQPAWEAVTVPTDAPSWTEYSGSGNWDFTDGVITFTNAGSGNSPVILTNVDHFGQAWAVETEIMVPDQSAYQVAFNAAAWIHNVESGEELNGAGFMPGSDAGGIDTCVYGNAVSACNTLIPDTEWHTYRAVILPLVQQIYFDGTLVGQTFLAGIAADPDGLKESRFLLFTAGFDAVAFRNLKAWRIPLPTFPA